MNGFLAIFNRDDTLYDSIIIASVAALGVLSVLAFVRPEALLGYGGGAAGIIVAMGGAKAARDWRRGDGDVHPEPH